MKKDIKLWIFCVLMTFLMLGSWCFSSAVQASVQDDFINQLSPDVINVAHKYNLYPSVMMAQAALESDFGQSSLSRDDNNYFGVKGEYNGQYVSMPTIEYNQQGQPYYVNSYFKKYPNTEASIEDNAQLIRNGVYGNPAIYSGAWRENATDGITAANALGDKYATDPNYANNLVSLIQQYNLNSLLDNAWKKLHIAKLKKRARQFMSQIKRYKKRYKKSSRQLRNYRNSARVASYRSKLIKYTKLYKDNQVSLDHNYHAFSVYDHLNRLDLDNWERLGASAGRPVYIDLMGQRNGQKYYRIRFSPSQHHKYWVQSQALSFIKPNYYYHHYRINAQQLDLSRAYNQIVGTNPSVRVVSGKFNRAWYSSDVFATVPQNSRASTWYRIKNRAGRSVWVTGNPNRPTQYLNYYEPKSLRPDYDQTRLTNHAADDAYRARLRTYSWSCVKPEHDRVNVDRLAINTRNGDQFWYRINNNHRTYWTNGSAFE